MQKDWSVVVGWAFMSGRELNRIEVLSNVSQERMTATHAAIQLGLSRRQVHRLLKTFQSSGPAAIRHKVRSRVSNNHIDPAIREFAVTLVWENISTSGRHLLLRSSRKITVLRCLARPYANGCRMPGSGFLASNAARSNNCARAGNAMAS